MIEPIIDVYGTFARRSALADYIELAAVGGRLGSLERLGDYIRDAEWTHVLGDRIRGAEEPEHESVNIGEELDVALERASDVASVIRERASILGDVYPFDVGSTETLVTYRESGKRPGIYMQLLCLSLAHGHGIALIRPPFEIFESVVVDVLRAHGWVTACIGTSARAGRSFEEALVETCGEVYLSVDPRTATRRTYARDEGTDTISNLWPADTRTGGLQVVGQVTCARSDDWLDKIRQPPTSRWYAWLRRSRRPEVFLAIPHHAENDHLAYLIEDDSRDVVDRLRLCGVDIVLEGEIAELTEHVCSLRVNLF